MAYGLRIWDASGVLKLDISDRLTRLVGTVTLVADQVAWYYIDCPLTGNADWICTVSNGIYFDSARVVKTPTGIKYYYLYSFPTTLVVNFYGV